MRTIALHGFTGEGADFAELRTHLPATTELVAPDLPGHGARRGLRQAEDYALRAHLAIIDEAGNIVRRGRIHELPLAEIDLVIVDEGHRIEAESYGAIIDAVRAANPAALMLFVTATPSRADGKSLGRWVKRAAFHYTLQEAIDEGYLSPLRGKRCDIDIDLSTVKTSRDSGDYQDADLGKAMDHPHFTILEETHQLAVPDPQVIDPNRCVNQHHSGRPAPRHRLGFALRASQPR
jgi:pimeloyl-ACP methyl ester carboxylesterase